MVSWPPATRPRSTLPQRICNSDQPFRSKETVMNMNAVLTGCSLFKNREVAFFAFEPSGRPGHSAFAVLLGANWHGYRQEPEWTAVGMACAKYPNSDDWVVVAGSSEGHLW